MTQKTILVVDDEPAIRDMIADTLAMHDFAVLQAGNAHEAHGLIIDRNPDLVLLDWMMPETTGIELIRRLRRSEQTARVPVILLTAKVGEDNTVQGLDAGADDYISKPFSPRQLVARINTVLRRVSPPEAEQVLQVGRLVFDPVGHRVAIEGEEVKLGPTEYRLLEFFITHQERVYTRDQILDHVWGRNVYMDERTVDVHIRRLRKALSIAGHERFVQTVRGAGYRFSARDLS